MQTKQQIQQLLTSAGIQPNKKLGQHFLIDLNLMRLLVDSARIQNNDIVLEVGCGTGSLTEALCDNAGKVTAVEINTTLAEIATKQLAFANNVEIINTDILKSKNTINSEIISALEQARQKYTGRILLVANLPYNAACPVMLNLIKGPTTVDAMYVTVQKEVAERMTAKPDSNDYGILSIYLSATGDVTTIRHLKPTVFWPQPKVESSMISFVRKEQKAGRIKNPELFSNVVNLFMGHRRKQLIGCIKSAQSKPKEIENWDKIFEKCSIDPHRRPQQLGPEEYIAIANMCYESLRSE
ncbi:MAG: 16S rRNA (adenine(1518)-N(6)/adenine(1519)-N(6))-dimethyltransferase RsmA [Planctomycetota bacterium]|jgi:16S rRNA (adenine1518-N6/adenine1519-N6)-dimethyltransferase